MYYQESNQAKKYKWMDQLDTDTFAIAASLKNEKQAYSDFDITSDEFLDWTKQMAKEEGNRRKSEQFLDESFKGCEAFREEIREMTKE